MKSGPCALRVYADDLLVMAEREVDVTAIFDLIGGHVQLKRAGLIRPSSESGGQLKLLGRIITRKRGERSVCGGMTSGLAKHQCQFDPCFHTHCTFLVLDQSTGPP